MQLSTDYAKRWIKKKKTCFEHFLKEVEQDEHMTFTHTVKTVYLVCCQQLNDAENN